jgi:excisionase family DNA binding protein
MAENKALTTKAAAEYIGVSTSTIYRMVEKGILEPSKTPGGQRRFAVSMLDEFMAQSKDISAPQNPSKGTAQGVENSEVNSHTAEALMDATDASDDTTEKEVEENLEDKPVDPRNTLNDLNGSKWLPETKSFFYQKGLGAKHPHAQIERQHPAPFSYQDVEHLIAFFTKKGMTCFRSVLVVLALRQRLVNWKGGSAQV